MKQSLVTLFFTATFLTSLQANADMKPNIQCVGAASNAAEDAESRANPGEHFSINVVKYLGASHPSPRAGKYEVELERENLGPTTWFIQLNADCEVLHVWPETTASEETKATCPWPDPSGGQCCWHGPQYCP